MFIKASHHILSEFTKLRRATLSFVMSVGRSVCLSTGNKSARTDFIRFYHTPSPTSPHSHLGH